MWSKLVQENVYARTGPQRERERGGGGGGGMSGESSGLVKESESFPDLVQATKYLCKAQEKKQKQ